MKIVFEKVDSSYDQSWICEYGNHFSVFVWTCAMRFSAQWIDDRLRARNKYTRSS